MCISAKSKIIDAMLKSFMAEESRDEKSQFRIKGKELTYFILKSCFTSVPVLMDFNLMFIHFSSLWRANDLFLMKIIIQPIRADFANIG